MGVLGLRGQGIPVLHRWIFPWNTGNLWARVVGGCYWNEL